MKFADIIDMDLTADKSQSSDYKEGLSEHQVKERLLKDGQNVLTGKRAVHPAKIITAQFKDILVIILLICTAVSVFMGEYTEAIAIAVIVLLNAAMGAAQEYKAEKTIEALKNMAAPKARVMRSGALKQIPAAEVVRGDIIEVCEGDRVPADAQVISESSLFSDEAMLTGESVPVQKTAGTASQSESLPDRQDMLYMGTTITRGKGKALVVGTGMKTQMGKIAGMINEIESEQTPLQKKLAQLGKFVGIGCLVICAVVTAAGILRGEDPVGMLLTGVSLAVAAVPEGLPAIVTISLALAVGRMVKKNALIRKLHAVETLGCASVICSDKTGTLTQNKMTVKKLFIPGTDIDVTGDGYQKAGSFKLNGRQINMRSETAAEMLLQTAVICNNASLSDEEFSGRDRAANAAPGSYKISGDPTEAALLVMAGKAGVFRKELLKKYEIIKENPFDSSRKMMSVEVKNEKGKRYLLVKGAPDIVLGRSKYIFDSHVLLLDREKTALIEQKNAEMANSALRVLGFAYRELGEELSGNLEQNLVFLGLAGMIDPPRPEAKQAVKICRSASIKTVMITGDHKLTACAVAEKIGIYHDGDMVVTGRQLDSISDEELAKNVNKITVFARVSPEHKLRIVRAFKKTGSIVAMTGDGVNDAPAVKEADIGVSMGVTGTDVTKQAADVILLDDNFATLVSAVEEGRVIYSNIRKFIRYLLSCNVGEVLTMFLGMIMGMPTILLPIQILIVNLVTDGLPAIALGLEPPESGIMKKRPRKQDESVFSGGLMFKIVFRGIIIALTTLAAFTSVYKQTGSIDSARTGAFLTLVLTQLLHVFECKSEGKSIFSVPYFNNIRLIGAVMISMAVVFAVIYVFPLRVVFSTTALTAGQLLMIAFYSLAAPVLSAVSMKFTRKKA